MHVEEISLFLHWVFLVQNETCRIWIQTLFSSLQIYVTYLTTLQKFSHSSITVSTNQLASTLEEIKNIMVVAALGTNKLTHPIQFKTSTFSFHINFPKNYALQKFFNFNFWYVSRQGKPIICKTQTWKTTLQCFPLGPFDPPHLHQEICS